MYGKSCNNEAFWANDDAWIINNVAFKAKLWTVSAVCIVRFFVCAIDWLKAKRRADWIAEFNWTIWSAWITAIAAAFTEDTWASDDAL